MPMTVVVTRDVEPRYRGYLASVMLEIAPWRLHSSLPNERCSRQSMDYPTRLVCTAW